MTESAGMQTQPFEMLGENGQVNTVKAASPLVANPGSLTAEQRHQIRRDPPVFMNAAEGAVYVDMCERNFREKARQGIFPSIRIGGRLLFRRDALNSTLAKYEVKAI